MSFWGVGPPTGECYGNLEAGRIINNARPAVGECFGQFAH
ncbi:hypothetical protein D187_007976 [Cystobacter fuscus DSM 2262]|uniref:Uncharacterized protein n=1 Tax=Cystobacter fuscus (strain ATCC 25194 / DSM 2262 / NBRC 100088 / M29) TaxID=1242864 RepID=S9Q5Q9_CYSF2|nr:hypothetical protein D187_007976 [Cystobacter fuscus DSM 2262]